MAIRDLLGYQVRWVRVVCCLGWAGWVVNAAHFQLLDILEYVFLDVLTDGNPWVGPPLPAAVAYGIALLFCLVPALPRFERPMAMVMCSTGLVALDWLVTALVFVGTGYLLPLASPVVGVFGATAVLQAMAWSDERDRRTRLEHVNTARIQFTDMLVHDLRRRMSTILTSVSLLEKEGKGDAAHAEVLAMLRASAERTLLEINNLLAIRTIEECGMRPRREPLALGLLLEESVAEHRAAADLAGVRLALTRGEAPMIEADRHMLSRVMTNLLWNAIQHAPEGTEITLGAAATDGWVEIAVANRGAPIPAERQVTLFRPFAARAAGGSEIAADGTGLGLTFCKFAVDAHGGQIRAESPSPSTGDGVRMIIRLPAPLSLQARNAR